MNRAAWAERMKAQVPLEQRADFLTDLQALVASLREERTPEVTALLRRHAALALDYMDEGEKKDRARAVLSERKP